MCFEELKKAVAMVNLERTANYSPQGLKERYLILPGTVLLLALFTRSLLPYFGIDLKSDLRNITSNYRLNSSEG